MDPIQSTHTYPSEHAAYFPVPGAHLYTVLHYAVDPIARVMLIGPFASERHFSYHPWVRWARYLSARHIEVLRYDYRGIGESTGDFAELTFTHWSEDVRLLGEWLIQRSPKIPLILHGLEIGALLAVKAFELGFGDGMLLWSAPPTANQALRSSLLLWAGLEQKWESSENHLSASEYIDQLEQGFPIEVQGYQWPAHLWHDSFAIELPAAVRTDDSWSTICGRPVLSLALDRHAAPLVKPHVMYQDLPDLGWLYARTFDFLKTLLKEGSTA